jgi:serine/threonine protein phosphatase PrpC
MEDAHCAELDVKDTAACFFGVYDGHGGIVQTNEKRGIDVQDLSA